MATFSCQRGHQWSGPDGVPRTGCPQCEYDDILETASMRKQANILADVLETRFPHLFKTEK